MWRHMLGLLGLCMTGTPLTNILSVVWIKTGEKRKSWEVFISPFILLHSSNRKFSLVLCFYCQVKASWLMRGWHGFHWPPHQDSCLSLTRYHPVATTIPPGCCSRDYHGDNPEVKGSVPGVGPPTMQAGSPGATLLPLWRLLFTACYFRGA